MSQVVLEEAEREAWRDIFHRPQRGFLSGCWSKLLEDICGVCQDVQWTCRRDLHVRGKPRNTGDRASAGLNQSRINLWAGSAVVSVTPRSSLLWSILICYSLNPLRYFMYLSTSLHLKLAHPSIPKTKAGSRWRVWICGKFVFRLLGTALPFQKAIFQKASAPEMVGDVAPAWLRVPAAALGLPAAECFAQDRWTGLSWSTDSGEKLWLSGSSTEISCSLSFLEVFLSFMWLLIQTMLAFMGALTSLLWKFASSLFNGSIKTKQNSLWIHPSLQNKAWQSLVPQISCTGILSCA